MSTEARLVHRVDGRCRLRLRHMRGDSDFFQRLSAGLRDSCPDADVIVNPATGSVLLKGRIPSVAELAQIGTGQGWFELVDETEARDSSESGPALLEGVESRQFLTALFLGLAAVQVVRGQIMVPAVSFLWYALAAGALTSPDE